MTAATVPMKINGVRCGTYNNRELGFPSVLTTTDPKLGLFLHQMRSNIFADRSLVFIDGRILMTDKNWIRDHVHVMKAMRHWEYDLSSFLNFIIKNISLGLKFVSNSFQLPY